MRDPDDLIGYADLPPDLARCEDARRKWPQRLAELHAVVTDTLRRAGVDAADRHAAQIVRAIAHYLGGRQIYLPRGDQLEQALRDREIWRAFRGDNIEELAAQHGLSVGSVYRILARQRALHHRNRQRGLFEQEDES